MTGNVFKILNYYIFCKIENIQAKLSSLHAPALPLLVLCPSVSLSCTIGKYKPSLWCDYSCNQVHTRTQRNITDY